MSVKPCVVIDTSVLVSKILFSHSTPAKALQKAYNHYHIILSPAVIAEMRGVLLCEKFDRYALPSHRARALDELMEFAQIISVRAEIDICRDPQDNKFLDLAMQGGAKYIITSDSDLLILHPFQNISILTSAAFMDEVI